MSIVVASIVRFGELELTQEVTKCNSNYKKGNKNRWKYNSGVLASRTSHQNHDIRSNNLIDTYKNAINNKTFIACSSAVNVTFGVVLSIVK